MSAALSPALTIPCLAWDTSFSLTIDTGASCNLLSLQAYSHLNSLYNLPLQPVTTFLQSVQGTPLPVSGAVSIPVRFGVHAEVLHVPFFVTSQFALSSDGLLGLHTLTTKVVDIFPNRRAILHKDVFYSSMEIPVPLLTLPTDSSSPPVDVAVPRPCPADSKLSVSATSLCAAVVVGDQYIRPSCSTIVPVRLSNAPAGSSVLSLPDTVRVHRLALESTLSLVNDDSITHALVTNVTGSPFSLRGGTTFASFEVVSALSFQDLPHLVGAGAVASVSTGSPAEMATQLEPHLKVSDYPEAKVRLIDLLAEHRSAIALPGEPLGLTDRITHSIVLQPDANPTYVPAYRLPHSQRAATQSFINDMLEEGIIQPSTSPWNSPLFLVKKKNGSYRPVVDFRKVNALTVPDHYPLPVLKDLLMSIGKGNSVFTTLDLKSGFWQIPLSKESNPAYSNILYK